MKLGLLGLVTQAGFAGHGTCAGAAPGAAAASNNAAPIARQLRRLNPLVVLLLICISSSAPGGLKRRSRTRRAPAARAEPTSMNRFAPEHTAISICCTFALERAPGPARY